jgi:hypothetical protein
MYLLPEYLRCLPGFGVSAPSAGGGGGGDCTAWAGGCSGAGGAAGCAVGGGGGWKPAVGQGAWAGAACPFAGVIWAAGVTGFRGLGDVQGTLLERQAGARSTTHKAQKKTAKRCSWHSPVVRCCGLWGGLVSWVIQFRAFRAGAIRFQTCLSQGSMAGPRPPAGIVWCTPSAVYAGRSGAQAFRRFTKRAFPPGMFQGHDGHEILAHVGQAAPAENGPLLFPAHAGSKSGIPRPVHGLQEQHEGGAIGGGEPASGRSV